MGDWGHSANTAEDVGRGKRGNGELCKLLRALASIEGLERLRVSSLDPADIDEEFLQTVGNSPGICPHLHLALQAGSASTLRRMRRRYTPEQYLKAARRWREIRPDGGLTTDIIVGFPGETEEEFQGSLEVARAAAFSDIHVFPYSPRLGTAAAEMGALVPPEVQNRHVAELLQLARQLSRDYAIQFIGQQLPVLIEAAHREEGIIEGRTPHYVKARARPDGPLPETGEVAWITMERWADGALEGRLTRVGNRLVLE